MGVDPASGELRDRRGGGGENRLPPALAVLAALAVYALLPSSLLFTNRLIVPAVEVALLVVLVAVNPTRFTRETTWGRWVSVGLSAVVILTNLVSLGLLISRVTSSSADNLLLGAMQLFATNVIGFALLYWELDRGGPVARHSRLRSELQAADFRFPQDEDDDAVHEVSRASSKVSGWIPAFGDYLYVSLTNSTAFSPTDTMPLSGRAKTLMAIQGTSSLLISLLVVARAVNTLGG